MNKLEKFYLLRQAGIPCPNFFEYKGDEIKGDNLWTVRCVLNKGNDTSLSKAIGVFSDIATLKAKEFQMKYGKEVTVFYYEYFVATTSGTLLITPNESYAEIVKGNLWNMSNSTNIDLVATYKNDDIAVLGNRNIMSNSNIRNLFFYTKQAKSLIKTDNIVLDWSLTKKEEILFYDFRELEETKKEQSI